MGMNTDDGHFVEQEHIQSWMQTIAVGDIVKLKGEQCQVTSIGDRTVTLTLLSADDRLRIELAAEGAQNRHERRRVEALMRKGRI